LLREVFGNPFRWIVIDPLWLEWNNRAIVRLAEGIYHDRAFDRLPILADALEDAGCQDADILYHCRQPDEHVKRVLGAGPFFWNETDGATKATGRALSPAGVELMLIGLLICVFPFRQNLFQATASTV